MRKLTALLVVGLLASTASAALSLQVVEEGDLGVNVGGVDLAYAVLAIVSDAGGTPNAYDGGIYGPLVQAGQDNSGDPFNQNKYSPLLGINGWPADVMELDSHFMSASGDPADILAQTAPAESNDWSLGKDPIYSYLDMGLDAGTGLTGVFTDTSAAGDTWAFARIVGGLGTTVDIIGETASPEGEYAALEQGYTFVPEPATMSLLALGGVAALIRRKR